MACVAQALQLASPELHAVTPVRLDVVSHVGHGDLSLPCAVAAQRLLGQLVLPLLPPRSVCVPVGVLALSHSGIPRHVPPPDYIYRPHLGRLDPVALKLLGNALEAKPPPFAAQLLWQQQEPHDHPHISHLGAGRLSPLRPSERGSHHRIPLNPSGRLAGAGPSSPSGSLT